MLVEKRRLQAPQRRQYTTLQAFLGEWTPVCKRPRRHPATIANATINEAVCQFQRELNALRRCSPCRLPRMGNSWRRQRKAMRGLGCGLFRTRAKRLKVFVGRSWRQPCRKLFAPCRRVVCRSKCLAAVGEVFRGAFASARCRGRGVSWCFRRKLFQKWAHTVLLYYGGRLISVQLGVAAVLYESSAQISYSVFLSCCPKAMP